MAMTILQAALTFFAEKMICGAETNTTTMTAISSPIYRQLPIEV